MVRDLKPETCIVRPADMFGENDRLLTWYVHFHANSTQSLEHSYR